MKKFRSVYHSSVYFINLRFIQSEDKLFTLFDYVIMHVKHKRECVQSEQGMYQAACASLRGVSAVRAALRKSQIFCSTFTNTHTQSCYTRTDWHHTSKFAVVVSYWHSENETTDIRHIQSNQPSLAKNNRRSTRLTITTPKSQVFFYFRAWYRKSIKESLHST